jgi:hypothetical protein
MAVLAAVTGMGRVAQADQGRSHRLVVTTGPEATLGFAEFCDYGTDTAGCAPAQGGLGWKLELAAVVHAQYEVGLGAALVRLPSQPFHLWRTGAVGTWRFSPEVVDTGYLTATVGIAGITSAIPPAPGNVRGAAARPVVPHFGLSLGRRWNPFAATIIGVALDGGLSLFSDDTTAATRFGHVLWLGGSLTVGYAL